MALQFPLTGESDAEYERSTKRESVARAAGAAGVQWPFGAGVLPAEAPERERILWMALEAPGEHDEARRCRDIGDWPRVRTQGMDFTALKMLRIRVAAAYGLASHARRMMSRS